MERFVKRREPARPGSIPDVLGMFVAEVRFYREVAPHIDLRVPACLEAHAGPQGTVLVLEDLSSWIPGAEPEGVARLLAEHHRRWEGRAGSRWPWLRPVGAAADLIGANYDRCWAQLSERADLPPALRRLGERLVGHVPAAELAEAGSGPLTLIHGDISASNLRTDPDGMIAFLDWEDVRSAAGVVDLAWLLVSSVEPDRWESVIAAYGPSADLDAVLPSAVAQGLFALADTDPAQDPAGASHWMARLETAARRLASV